MKACTTCGVEKSDGEYQVRRASPDGLTASCKECLRARDKARDSMPHRLELRRRYQASPAGKQRHAEANTRYRRRNPDAARCHNAINKAILRGHLVPWPCESCGEKAEAHHPHYGAPMLVTWLCDQHHKEAHAVTKSNVD